jgi:hypothetical protein
MKRKEKKYNNPLVKTTFRRKKDNGYILVVDGMKWVLEHKKVMEAYIGRALKEGETIHHISGDKMDNRIENLMLFPNQKEHKAFENKIRQFGMTTPILKQISERFKEYGK